MQQTTDKGVSLPVLKASIIVILLFQTCALFARSYTLIQMEEGGMPHQIAKDLSWLVVPVIMGILMLPLLRQYCHPLKALFRCRTVTLRLVLSSVALGVTLRLAHWGGLITNASFQIFTSPGPDSIVGPQFVFQCPSPSTLVLATLVSVLMTPLLEEVINRGFILQALMRRGRWPAIIISAILFGIFHHPQSIVPATIAGVFLALQFLNSGSLWACTITHATYNALVILDWQCLNTIWNPDKMTQATSAVGALSLALLLASLALAATLTQQRWYASRSGRNAPR